MKHSIEALQKSIWEDTIKIKNVDNWLEVSISKEERKYYAELKKQYALDKAEKEAELEILKTIKTENHGKAS